MSNKKSLLEEAFLDANEVKKTALENAKNAIAESLSPTLNSIFAQKIQEMEDDENLEDEDLLESDEDTDLNQVNEDDELGAEDEELEDTESEEESEEEFDIEDMSAEELEQFIEDTVADMLDSGELGSDEAKSEEDLDLSDDEAMQDDLSGEDSEDIDLDIEDDSTEEDEDVDINELMLEIEKEKIAKSRLASKSNNPKSNIVYERKIKSLQRELNETKLYNAKLLYANKLIVNKDLSSSQKRNVLETLDKAKTTNEAKLIYESLSSTLVTETKKQVIRRPASDVMSNITESVQKDGIISADPFVQRMQKLAGIIK